MKTDAEWEARARELAIQPSMSGPYGIHHTEPWMGVAAALQLGREMAQERTEYERARCASFTDGARQEAADARAEEIIERLNAEVRAEFPNGGVVQPHSWASAMWHAMAVARSTIAKPTNREQVLEEALRRISLEGYAQHDAVRMHDEARRALEWKP